MNFFIIDKKNMFFIQKLFVNLHHEKIIINYLKSISTNRLFSYYRFLTPGSIFFNRLPTPTTEKISCRKNINSRVRSQLFENYLLARRRVFYTQSMLIFEEAQQSIFRKFYL